MAAAAVGSPLPSAQALQGCSGRTVTFNFREAVEGVSKPVPSISPAQQEAFKAAFCREMESIERWAAAQQWPPPPRLPRFRIHVSGAYEHARSLVPLWKGEPGRMEFPAYRVAVGEANIVHELVHVYFPNGNRMLAEGLAVYLQQRVGGNPAYPNFKEDLHVMIKCQVSPPSFRNIHLAPLDKISTPTELKLRIGSKLEENGWTYVIAGSFVQYLLEGLDPDRAALLNKFRALYSQTSLVPLHRNAGALDRWKNVYGIELTELEQKWKSMIQGLSCP